ncbi:MAG: hypothetical protein ABI808_12975 [Pseudonocardiales bacterium]
MTSTQTHTPARAQTPQPHPARSARLQLSATQLIASALAAVTATIAASYLGVSGTVIGAAIASVVTVTGNAVYGHSLHRTSERVRTVVPTTARWLPPVHPDLDPPPVPAEPLPRAPLTRKLALAAVAVFATVLALVTSVELIAGHPLSDLLRGTSSQGTTVFGTQPESSNEPAQPAPTVTQTVVPKVVLTTPTVTQTAPAVTKTATPTVTPSPPTTTPSPTATTPPPTAPPPTA